MISGLQVLKVLLFGWKNNLIKADLLNEFMVSFSDKISFIGDISSPLL